MQASIPCYLGNEIKIKTQQYLSLVEYGEWIKLSEVKSLIILQECLKKSTKVQVVGLIGIDLDTFLAIIKATYSLVTFLYTSLKKL